ncbi:MAG: hypothetical protein GEEBNDBF_00643 [bacterium]|nr:hypothetical protein [bacterium]
MKDSAPWLQPQEIERQAQLLLEQAQASGIEITVPIPVEEIAEVHCRLGMGFYDLNPEGGTDTLAALYLERGEILVDTRLNPDDYPWMQARYLFTIGHELGHFTLHQRLLLAASQTLVLFTAYPEPPTIINRAFSSDDRIERQANQFAACLLMPADLVRQEWARVYGSTQPLFPSAWQLTALGLPYPTDSQDPVAEATKQLALPLAERFHMSRQAMSIRIEELGLIQRADQTFLGFDLP